MAIAQAALSGGVAAAVAVASTVAIERCGGVLGGVLATTPTTILPAAVGIVMSSPSADAATVALYTIPMAMACDAVLLGAWAVLPPCLPSRMPVGCRAVCLALLSFIAWLIPASTVWAVSTYLLGTAPAVRVAGLCVWGVTIVAAIVVSRRPPEAPKGTKRVSCLTLASRGLGAGLAIFSAVLLASLSPVVGGLLAAFPAIFLTSMVALYVSQGEATTVGAVLPMIVGSQAVSAFAVLYSELWQILGVWPALPAVYAFTILFVSVPAALWLRWRSRVRGDPEKAGGPADEAGDTDGMLAGKEAEETEPEAGGVAVEAVPIEGIGGPRVASRA